MGSWSRFGPWLPWFEMGQTPGGCLYNAPFFKLESVEDLPDQLYSWTVENYPEYLHPPKNYSTPNKTSWRVFKEIIDKRRQNGEDDIQVPEQPEKSYPKEPNLDPEVMNMLANKRWVSSKFEGTSFFVLGR